MVERAEATVMTPSREAFLLTSVGAFVADHEFDGRSTFWRLPEEMSRLAAENFSAGDDGAFSVAGQTR